MSMKKFFAPGRVNLIGEHLDYNGGLVLPAALEMGITLTVTESTGNTIKLRSSSHSFQKEFNADDNLEFDSANDWANYPMGVIQHLKREGFTIPTVELFYESNLPEGAGLSSSAAIEVLTAYALLSVTNANINLTWLADFCRNVENEFIGVKCGIMDQYSVALGKKDHAILLDCAAVKHTYVPFDLEEYRLVIMNTNKPRSLIHSKYNERKAECDEALRIIQTAISGIKHLCDAEMHHLDLIADETIQQRARHVISENLRVKEAVKVLRFNDLSTFGRLMNASHRSLKEDYEVTGIELDTLAETAQETKGCLGARMTGAGFGGCAIAIVNEAALNEFKETVSKKYTDVTRLTASFYETVIGDGVRAIEA